MVKLLLAKALTQLAKAALSGKTKLIAERVLGLSRSFSINKDMGVKISELPIASLPYSETDEIPIVQTGDTKRTTLSSFTGYYSSVFLGDYTLTNTLCARSTKERFEGGEYVDIKDFGAVGDGVTDDWLAIQRAIYAASDVPFGTSGWPAPSAVTENDLLTFTASGKSFTRPRIWGNEGLKPVYIPTGKYLISKPLIIIAGAKLYGNSPRSSTLILSAGAMCSFIETAFKALKRMYPGDYEKFDDFNNNCAIKDLELTRFTPSGVTPPYSDPDKKDWYPTSTQILCATAGSSVLSSTQAYPVWDYPIKLLHEYGTANEKAYNIQKVVYGSPIKIYLDSPVNSSSPLSGTRYLTGLPALKGIFTNGGENFDIERVQVNLAADTPFNPRLNTRGVGIFVYGGSPTPTIFDCMVNTCEVGYWVDDNGCATLIKPSGDNNKTFFRGGMLGYTQANIINPKIEGTWGDVFELGTVQAGDANNYIIQGGNLNASGALTYSALSATTLSSAVILNRAKGGTEDAHIFVTGFRAYSPSKYYLRTVDKQDPTYNTSTYVIPKSASCWGNAYASGGSQYPWGAWPQTFHWDGTRDINMLMEKTSTQYRVISGLTLGPFASDVAAGTGGISVGSLYRKSDGTTAWRVS